MSRVLGLKENINQLKSEWTKLDDNIKFFDLLSVGLIVQVQLLSTRSSSEVETRAEDDVTLNLLNTGREFCFELRVTD